MPRYWDSWSLKNQMKYWAQGGSAAGLNSRNSEKLQQRQGVDSKTK